MNISETVFCLNIVSFVVCDTSFFGKARKKHRTWRLPPTFCFIIEHQVISEYDGEFEFDLSCSLVAEARTSE